MWYLISLIDQFVLEFNFLLHLIGSSFSIRKQPLEFPKTNYKQFPWTFLSTVDETTEVIEKLMALPLAMVFDLKTEKT